MTLSGMLEDLKRRDYEGREDTREEVSKDAFTAAVEEAISSPKGFVIAAITSNTQASFESKMTPYGAGKTSLAFQLSYRFNHFDPETGRYYDLNLDPNDIRNWETTNDNAWYYPSRILKAMKKASEQHNRIRAGIWDDVQYSAPATTGVPKPVVKLVSDLTTDRPEIGVLFLTMPNVLDIASVLRFKVQYELIVHSRGRYEVQKTTYRKDFKNPRKDFIRLEYVSGKGADEQKEPDFGPLPDVEQTWYDAWRAKEKGYGRENTIEMLERFEHTRRPEETLPQPVAPLSKPIAERKGWGEE